MREALAAALKSEQRAMALVAMVPGSTTQETLHRLTVLSLARERLAQLPEKCPEPDCDNGILKFGSPRNWTTHASCHGSGKVYPAELVALFEQTLMQCWKQRATFEAMALTLLDALSKETP